MRSGRGYDTLIRDHYRKWVFHKTELTYVYNMERFKAERPDAELVAEVAQDGNVFFLGPKRAPKGEPGMTIISFGPELNPKVETPPPTSGQPPSNPPLPKE